MTNTEDPVRKKRRSWFLRLMLGFLGLVGCAIALVVIGSALIGSAATLNAVSHFVATVKPFFYLLHCLVIFLLWWYWSAFVKWLEARGSISPMQSSAILGGRNRIIWMLAAIEVFVVIGFPFRYIVLN